MTTLLFNCSNHEHCSEHESTMRLKSATETKHNIRRITSKAQWINEMEYRLQYAVKSKPLQRYLTITYLFWLQCSRTSFTAHNMTRYSPNNPERTVNTLSGVVYPLQYSVRYIFARLFYKCISHLAAVFKNPFHSSEQEPTRWPRLQRKLYPLFNELPRTHTA